MKLRLIGVLLFCLSSVNAQSFAHSSSEIYHDLLRLQKNATVMYLAAHPDDENTKVISWLTNEKYVDAVYLSLTRGDGGQNLIGAEIGDMLGLLRTQELLEARSIDRGRQWFTRAVDFGYSKTATETLEIWDKQEVLSDVVWAIRKNKPEIIITRFSPDSNGNTHGHHTASAILAMEAFDLAADKNAFPEQLMYVSTWQVKRMFFNTSWWFYGSQEKFDHADKSDMLAVDVGNYFPLLGKSNNEISAMSRSQHACQGFGMALERGSQTEWFKLLRGEMPKNEDIFEGISLAWENKNIQKLIDNILIKYDFKNPEYISGDLLILYSKAKAAHVDELKMNQIKDLILKTQGIYFEWTTSSAFEAENQSITTNLELTYRGTDELNFTMNEQDFQLLPNQSFKENFNYKIKNAKFSSPYWLENKPKKALHQIDFISNIGQPEITHPITYPITLSFPNQEINIEIPLQQKIVDPAIGEIYEPFYTVPAFVSNFAQENYIFNDQEKLIAVEVKSFVAGVTASVSLETNEDWRVSPAQKFTVSKIGESRRFLFRVKPNKNAESSLLKAVVTSDGYKYEQSLEVVNYPHIRRQLRLKEATTQLRNLDLKMANINLAYLQGSGDEVPANLRQVGLSVDELDVNLWNHHTLEKYDVVMLGIRAYNTLEKLAFIQKELFSFVENGGVVIVQYNTNRNLVSENIGPYELRLGRDRISEENADLKILKPSHPIFNKPNKITSRDFDHWVQERGLYFASEWAPEFNALLEGHDTNESPKQGILLVADYGKGKFIYTGLSFFRQLPAGVPGAYRLLMNMLALGEGN